MQTSDSTALTARAPMTVRLGGQRFALVPTADGETPLEPGHWRLTHREILDWMAGLNGLSQRRVEKRDTTKKFLWLFNRLETPHRLVERLQRELYLEHPAPEGWESENLPVTVNEARQHALAEFYDETIDIKAIPSHMRITDEDLPKLMKGEVGDANQMAVTFLCRQLGRLYVGNDVEPEVVKDGEDGVEKEG